MRTFLIAVAGLGIIAFSTVSVLAAPKKVDGGIHWIQHLVPHNLRVRRPKSEGADPKVMPGGADYTSHPLPDEHFDCEAVSDLFVDFKLPELRACVLSIKPGTVVPYKLRREALPYLYLEEPQDAPECLRTLAPKLPVPREIFFQSNDEGELLCYSARIDVAADEVFGAKIPTHRVRLNLKFPPNPTPDTDDETRMMLFTWVMAPFWDERPFRFKSKIVTDAICDACMGRKNRVQVTDAPPALWP